MRDSSPFQTKPPQKKGEGEEDNVIPRGGMKKKKKRKFIRRVMMMVVCNKQKNLPPLHPDDSSTKHKISRGMPIKKWYNNNTTAHRSVGRSVGRVGFVGSVPIDLVAGEV